MNMKLLRTCAAMCIIVIFSQLSLAKLPENKAPFDYFARGEPLSSMLSNFAAHYDLPVTISPAIKDVANGGFKSDSAEAFLKRVARLYEIDWYYDGRVLHISPVSETQSRLLTLNNLSPTQFEKMLKRADMWDERFRWRKLSDDGVLYVSGPPRFVALVSETAVLVEQQANERRNKTLALEIFPLQHASATDRQYQMRDQKMATPGVATILKNVLLSGGGASASTQFSQKPESKETKGKAKQGAQNGTQTKTISAIGSSPAGASIEAIPQLNAVLVQDTLQRMALYRALIKELDKPQPQVEITLSIIDVNAANLDELGVDWNLSHDLGNGNAIQFVTPGGLEPVTTIAGSNLTQFVSRVKLLSQKGKARIASRPAILTENNTEAVLDFSSTFYVPLTGREVAQLESVAYGTILNLRPRVINLPNKKRVAMKIHIEDGNQAPDKVSSGLPLVDRTNIDTVATINENESLLIGGYFKDLVITDKNKVPFFGSIPLLGRLFSSNSHKVEQRVRLFLLQPRVLEPGKMNNPADITADQLLLGQSIFNDKRVEKQKKTSKKKGSKQKQEVPRQQHCYPLTISDSIKAWLVSQGYEITESKCTTKDGQAGLYLLPKAKKQ